jgi:hypothetical protein
VIHALVAAALALVPQDTVHSSFADVVVVPPDSVVAARAAALVDVGYRKLRG